MTSVGARRVNQFRFSYAGEDITFTTAAGFTPRAEEIHPSFRAGSAQFIFGTPFEIPVHWTDRSFQFEDTFSIVAGAHDVKIGGSFYHATVTRELFPRLGQFTFGSDLPFDAADPRTYPIRYTVPVGDRSFTGSNEIAAGFVDDRWTASPRLTVNLGLRWERESITPDVDEFRAAPRRGLGSARQPARAAARVLRHLFGQALFQFYELPQVFGPDGVVVFDVRDNGPLSGQFPASAVLLQYPRIPTFDRASFARNPNPDTIDPDRQLPSVATTSVGGQVAVGDVVIKADYVYARGTNLFRARDINPFDVQTGTRPDPLFNRVRQFETTANSWYHGLLTSVTRRLSGAFRCRRGVHAQPHGKRCRQRPVAAGR